MDKIISVYNQGLNLIPELYRVPLASLILIFLVFALIKFFKKNLIWIVFFVILLPAAWPAIKQVGLFVFELIKKIPK